MPFHVVHRIQRVRGLEDRGVRLRGGRCLFSLAREVTHAKADDRSSAEEWDGPGQRWCGQSREDDRRPACTFVRSASPAFTPLSNVASLNAPILLTGVPP